MWTIATQNDFLKFLNQYPQLQEYATDIILKKINNKIFLPKFTYYLYPSEYLQLFNDPEFNPIHIDIDFNKSLWPEQQQIILPFIQQYSVSNTMTGTLKARPGAGKTVMGIYLATILKYKTLIMLNNTALTQQWIDAVLNFTTCTEDDIGLIQGNTFNVENKKIIIGMVQTFCSRVQKEDVSEFYDKIKQIGIGFCLFDECHHSISGPKYALSSLLINTTNIVGLSATPYHVGLQEFLMTGTVGNILSDTKNYDIKPKVNIVKFNSYIDQKIVNSIYKVGDMLKQRAKYNAVIADSERYMNLLLALNNELLTKGHRIINIVFTKKQVQKISDYLLLHNIDNIQFYSEQRELNKTTDKCLVATYKFAGEGFDYKELSALIIATPLSGKKSLIQVIGRILRSCNDKKSPEVYILVDKRIGNVFTKDISRITKIIKDEFQVDSEIIDLN